jgi:ABC-type phosphate transport system substrate-binding protein
MARALFILTLLAGVFGLPPGCAADVVVIINARSSVERLTQDEVINIFLGRFRQLPSGIAALPADLPATQPEKATFYRLLVNKDLADLNAYWARLIFSGRTAPPRQTRGNDEMLRYVAETPGALGYIERARSDSRVKVVFEFLP